MSPGEACRLTSQDHTKVIFQDLALPYYFSYSAYMEHDCDLLKVLGNLRKVTISFRMMPVIQ